MDIFQFEDYRDILRKELIRRTKQNCNYSQGAFARDLGLSPSRLSEVLNGKQGLSVKVAIGLAKLLRLGSEEQEFFGTLVECQHGRSRLARKAAQLRLTKFRHRQRFKSLPVDLFKALSCWYHLAILELQKFDEFRWDVAWISQHLGIAEQEAQDAVQRLTSLGLLVEQQTYPRLRPRAGMLHGLANGLPCQTNLGLHTDFLKKVQELVVGQQGQVSCSFAIAIDSNKIAQINDLIKQSIERLLLQISEQTPVKDQLYLFVANFVPCTSQQFKPHLS